MKTERNLCESNLTVHHTGSDQLNNENMIERMNTKRYL